MITDFTYFDTARHEEQFVSREKTREGGRVQIQRCPFRGREQRRAIPLKEAETPLPTATSKQKTTKRTEGAERKMGVSAAAHSTLVRP